jgi:hypothetical protein
MQDERRDQGKRNDDDRNDHDQALRVVLVNLERGGEDLPEVPRPQLPGLEACPPAAGVAAVSVRMERQPSAASLWVVCSSSGRA